jgi:hypothetical protein
MAGAGDTGSNAPEAMLGLNSVDCLTGRGRWIALAARAGLTALDGRTSLGRISEWTPVVRRVDEWGRI